MTEKQENFWTLTLHEARELRVGLFAGTTQLALTMKRFNEFGVVSVTGTQDMLTNGQHFTKLTQLNRTRLLFSFLGNNIAPQVVSVPLRANNDSGVPNDSRFKSIIANEQNQEWLIIMTIHWNLGVLTLFFKFAMETCIVCDTFRISFKLDFFSVINKVFCLSMYISNSNVHIRKAVYFTQWKYKTNKRNGTFERDGDGKMIHQSEIMKFVMDYNRYLDRMQHNEQQQGFSSSTKQLLKIAFKREKAEDNFNDEEKAPLSRFKSAKRAIAKSETEVVSLLDDSEQKIQLSLMLKVPPSYFWKFEVRERSNYLFSISKQKPPDMNL